MKKVSASIISLLFYLVIPFILIIAVYKASQIGFYFDITTILSELLVGSFFVYLASLILSLNVFKEQSHKIMKITFCFSFAVYVTLLLNLTIFSSYYGRGYIDVIFQSANYDEYINHYVNLVPFKTIEMYNLNFLGGGSVSRFFRNILGNLVAFMPFALFLPLIFKKCRKFPIFLLFVLIINLIVEISQLLFMVGSFDIDDIFLNCLGAVILYAFLHLPPIRKLVIKATRLEY